MTANASVTYRCEILNVSPCCLSRPSPPLPPPLPLKPPLLLSLLPSAISTLRCLSLFSIGYKGKVGTASNSTTLLLVCPKPLVTLICKSYPSIHSSSVLYIIYTQLSYINKQENTKDMHNYMSHGFTLLH